MGEGYNKTSVTLTGKRRYESIQIKQFENLVGGRQAPGEGDSQRGPVSFRFGITRHFTGLGDKKYDSGGTGKTGAA